jgi:hypothetical protein
VNEDTERRYVVSVLFGDDDVEALTRVLQGHVGALGEDDKQRDRVGRHLHRIKSGNEAYNERDLEDLGVVLHDLYVLWSPQRTPAWWRKQGAPGEADAIAGLAQERTIQCERAIVAFDRVDEIVREVRRRG